VTVVESRLELPYGRLAASLAAVFAALLTFLSFGARQRCVNAIIDWNWSRRFFYGRLRRRMQENAALDRLAAAHPSATREDNQELLRSLVTRNPKPERLSPKP